MKTSPFKLIGISIVFLGLSVFAISCLPRVRHARELTRVISRVQFIEGDLKYFVADHHKWPLSLEELAKYTGNGVQSIQPIYGETINYYTPNHEADDTSIVLHVKLKDSVIIVTKGFTRIVTNDSKLKVPSLSKDKGTN